MPRSRSSLLPQLCEVSSSWCSFLFLLSGPLRLEMKYLQAFCIRRISLQTGGFSLTPPQTTKKQTTEQERRGPGGIWITSNIAPHSMAAVTNTRLRVNTSVIKTNRRCSQAKLLCPPISFRMKRRVVSLVALSPWARCCGIWLLFWGSESWPIAP